MVHKDMKINMKITFFGSNTMGEKGQVVIPVEGRQAMDLNPGEKLIFLGDPQMNVLIVAKPEIIEERMQKMQSHFQAMREQINEHVGGNARRGSGKDRTGGTVGGDSRSAAGAAGAESDATDVAAGAKSSETEAKSDAASSESSADSDAASADEPGKADK